MSATSTNTSLWDKIYAWAHSVLPSVEVVEGYENAPSPKGNYIAIDYAGTWRFAGTTPSRKIEGREDLPSPKVFIYRGQVQIREIDGDGENLMLLAESLHDNDVLAEFEAAGISVLKTDGPTMMPALQQTKWRKESLLTLEMTWARAYAGTTLTIGSVEVNGVVYPVGNENLSSG